MCGTLGGCWSSPQGSPNTRLPTTADYCQALLRNLKSSGVTRPGSHVPVPMAPREGSVLSTVTLTPSPHVLTARPESCYGDSQESSEDPLTAPAMVSPFPVRNR